MLNNVVSLIILASVLGTAYPQWVHRSKKYFIFPELAIHFKQPKSQPPQALMKDMQPAPIERKASIELSEDQSKRQVRELNVDVPPTPKDKSSISHPCYFSPVQCLLELPEEQLRTLVKNQGAVNDGSSTLYRRNNERLLRYDDIQKNIPAHRFLHFNDHRPYLN